MSNLTLNQARMREGLRPILKIALITTTIYVPEVLRKYREYGPDVRFVIAGDQKTPHADLYRLAGELGDTCYLHPDDQEQRWPALSRAIGWNSIQRRNLAVLEAARLKPDVIVSVDDDNEPMRPDYFTEIAKAFAGDHTGPVATGEWFDLGSHGMKEFRYRGLPLDAHLTNHVALDGSHPVGVLNGLIYGDPDIDAVTRITLNPKVLEYTGTARNGVATVPTRGWTSINSQNTAWRTELAPLMMVLPHVGRYDDIWGSYIAQRVMEATPYCVRFGEPAVHQDRHDQDVLKNLENELFGMRHTPKFVQALKDIEVDPSASVLSNLAAVLAGLKRVGIVLPRLFFQEWQNAWEELCE